MKFNLNSYHFKLLKDYERLSVFKEAIDDYAKTRKNDYNLSDNRNNDINSNLQSDKKIAFDLGCGSGVLSYFARDYFDKIISIELNESSYKLAKENLKDFDNIQVFNEDILNFDFNRMEDKADLIICEMLDTALIDEEEVPVLNYAKKFLKEDGVIIPHSIINSAEAIFMNNHFIQYEDDEFTPIYITLAKSSIYSEFKFLDDIDPDFSTIIDLKIFNKEDLEEIRFEDEISKEKFEKFNFKENFNIRENKLKINGIKLTSFTRLNENIICGPTPMLNPSLLIPIEEMEVICGDIVRIKLEYIMGGELETIKTEVLEIIHN
ncbi:methyltransferase domain-containing protein [Methanobrevibacter olleyae]|uniref:RNA methylase n=1 Tax=Methanobrevibacter olleyae TaxID=294671 RepID=A0A126QYC3_METOL|nr:methyltransferase domain-containing protein [Methanobrevibacter olleyae]AMK15140.1 RNA methylase [Methanobrevibacter olleyae]SFL51107.1 Predicted RNA methylase [Methanobrevibacter olleyae]